MLNECTRRKFPHPRKPYLIFCIAAYILYYLFHLRIVMQGSPQKFVKAYGTLHELIYLYQPALTDWPPWRSALRSLAQLQ